MDVGEKEGPSPHPKLESLGDVNRELAAVYRKFRDRDDDGRSLNLKAFNGMIQALYVLHHMYADRRDAKARAAIEALHDERNKSSAQSSTADQH